MPYSLPFVPVLSLMQDESVGPAVGAGQPGGAATQGAPGGGPPPAQPGPFGGGSIIWMMLLFFFVIIIWSMMGQRREKKKRDAMLSTLRKHDEVQTIGGIIGSVVDVKGNTVVLKVDEASNTRIRVARSAIQQVLSESAAAASEKEPAKEKEAVSE
jgi:preprotein translocase subunit YajC